jgi:hypothetical protein
MKGKIKLFGSTLIAFIALMACEKSSLTNDSDLEENIAESENDAHSSVDSLDLSSFTDSLTSNVITDYYIQRGGKNFKLDDGSIYVSQYTYQGKSFVRVILHSWNDYYVLNQENKKELKQNAVLIQFLFEDADQFQPKTYQIVPSEVNTGFDFQFTPTEQTEKFPNDSLCIGFYHIQANWFEIEWMSLGYSYGFTNFFVLKSGEIMVTKNYSEYEVSGNLFDAQDEEVKIKFKVIIH